MRRLDPQAAARFKWTIVTAEYPVFDVIFNHDRSPLRLRLECTQWDELPPSIELLHADGTHVAKAPPCIGNVFHPGVHPSTGRFFVCMRGAREYHTHPSHIHESWANYRGKSGNDLIGLVGQLYHAWKAAVQ